MHLNRFDLNLLIALDALLRERSVTRAGERVNLSQSAMSGALQRLRDYFGDELLVRVGRELELTPRGKALVEPVRDILLRTQAALAVEPTFDPATSTRGFSLVMSDYCFLTYMREVLKRIQSSAPGISCYVELIAADSVRRLEAGEIDLLLMAETPQIMTNEARTSTTLRRSELFTDDWVCAIWREHPTIGDELTLDEYLALPHAVANFGTGTDTIENLAVRNDGLKLNTGISYGGFSMLGMLLEGTPLVATIQRRLGKVLLPGFPIRLLSPPIALAPVREMLYWHARHEFEPGHVWLRNLMIDTARSF